MTPKHILVIALAFKVVLCESEPMTYGPLYPEPLAPCDTCCRGPQGINGLNGEHGLPGRDGVPGLDGMKGERGYVGEPGLPGSQGERGRRGPPGADGFKGERGVSGLNGMPGSTGQRGDDGFPGIDGLPGIKGQKGDSGAPKRRSAFTVVRSAPQTPTRSLEAVNFTRFFTNEGNHFDLERDRFTCSIPGVYVFSFQAVADYVQGDNYMELVLLKNKKVITVAATGVSKAMASGSVILSLQEGDKVQVSLGDSGDTIFCDEYKQCVFSGFLLYEN